MNSFLCFDLILTKLIELEIKFGKALCKIPIKSVFFVYFLLETYKMFEIV